MLPYAIKNFIHVLKLIVGFKILSDNVFSIIISDVLSNILKTLMDFNMRSDVET